jgi:hypothetical protein
MPRSQSVVVWAANLSPQSGYCIECEAGTAIGGARFLRQSLAGQA